MRLPFLPLALLATLQPLTAQLGWERVASPSAPSPRYEHAMTEDSSRQALLFGGTDGTAVFADTWRFDGGRWRLVVCEASPPARHGHALASYDLAGRNLLFGGTDSSGRVLGDTWRFDGANWTPVATRTSPPARTDHRMVFDPWRLVYVLFGGRDAAGALLDDTWEFDGTRWIERQTAQRAPARVGHTLVGGGRRGVLLIGGTGPQGVLADAWEWDGLAWRTALVPPASSTGAAADFVGWPRYRVVLFGGRDRAGVAQAGTLELTEHPQSQPRDWLDHGPAAGPAARSEHALAAWNSGREVVLFGGRDANGRPLGDTWRLQPQHVAAIEEFGSSCGGAPWGSGPAMFQSRPPLRGHRDYGIRAFAAPDTPVVLLVGVKELARDFGPCRLLVEPSVTVGMVTSPHGFATVPMPVPFDPALGGVTLVTQLVAPDPLGFAGIGFSRGVRMTIGD